MEAHGCMRLRLYAVRSYAVRTRWRRMDKVSPSGKELSTHFWVDLSVDFDVRGNTLFLRGIELVWRARTSINWLRYSTSSTNGMIETKAKFVFHFKAYNTDFQRQSVSNASNIVSPSSYQLYTTKSTNILTAQLLYEISNR
jgi:hypothetical protein